MRVVNPQNNNRIILSFLYQGFSFVKLLPTSTYLRSFGILSEKITGSTNDKVY